MIWHPKTLRAGESKGECPLTVIFAPTQSWPIQHYERFDTIAFLYIVANTKFSYFFMF